MSSQTIQISSRRYWERVRLGLRSMSTICTPISAIASIGAVSRRLGQGRRFRKMRPRKPWLCPSRSPKP